MGATPSEPSHLGPLGLSTGLSTTPANVDLAEATEDHDLLSGPKTVSSPALAGKVRRPLNSRERLKNGASLEPQEINAGLVAVRSEERSAAKKSFLFGSEHRVQSLMRDPGDCSLLESRQVHYVPGIRDNRPNRISGRSVFRRYSQHSDQNTQQRRRTAFHARGGTRGCQGPGCRTRSLQC